MSDWITSAELDALERLCAEATPGPWVEFADRGETVAIMAAGRPDDVCGFAPPYPRRPDACLIAASRRDVPRLVARVRELEATISDAIEEIEAGAPFTAQNSLRAALEQTP